ncbi:Bcr/CflA family drug resistance efflux transporter [Bacillus sp. FJAT-27264]|uniref:multidrug effflux MFS transporter n=1 Tax=Paenibacillus sp. (strain DSM 101736 / FJAT-27264) TaxID=1850362 RepID=UPI000807EAE8|nr:multidrug effflux MFS transporter [Bacillus sp. FJAT-27264]OBZ14896.1 Bcr/CflA family drug resistance efflux transporter [Bacillus sp. FJAT-27264]
MISSSKVNTGKPAKAGRLWIALILGALTAFGPLSLDMYLPSLPDLAKDLHSSPSLAQLSLTACLVGLAVGQLVAGPLSDVRGRRMPLIVGLSLYVITSFLCSMSTSIEALIVLRFIQGLGGSAGVVVARAMVRDMYSGTELTRFFALLMLINGVAPIAAPIAGGQLLRFTSWPGVFIVLGVIGLVMLASVLFGLRETLPEAQRSGGGLKSTLATFGRLLGDRMFMGYALSQGLVFAAMFAYIAGSPFVIQNLFGATPQMFSLIFAVNGLGIIITGQVTGKLAERFGETKLLVAGLIYAAVGGLLLLAMTLLGAGLIATLIPLFMVVSSVGIVSTAAFSLAMQQQGQSAGSASALQGLLSMIGGALVAPLVGLGGSGTALPMGIVIAVADVGAILCYVLMIRRSGKKL